MKIISAGAGSGKTFRLTQEMVALLSSGKVRARGIIATTFTNKAAAELQERVRIKLLEEGLTTEADELANALIGTVHGLGVKLLKRFAFEAGVSPEVNIIADEDQQIMFNQSLATVLKNERIAQMEGLADRLGLNKNERYDWRREVKSLTDVARANDFGITILEESKAKSFDSFQKFMGKVSTKTPERFNEELLKLLEETINTVEANEDETKKTSDAIKSLKIILNELKYRGSINWYSWVKIAKVGVGAKSREDVEKLKNFAWEHDTNPAFHQDIKEFITGIFDVAIEALQEYEQYKKSRGLIDYIDMEIQVKRLLDNPEVQKILEEELDLLMVDEFQDTSPIQLEIFYKLSRFAKFSVWVGDPKQSIYGFRGADPKLMQAIIEKQGGVKPEDIQAFSWRSREDIVNATNAIFVKAFTDLPTDQVALKPKRTKKATTNSQNKTDEPIEMDNALMHWHFTFDGEKKRHPAGWLENCIAESTRVILERKKYILPKGEKEVRVAKAGDVAILCRSNAECQKIADALHRAGIKAAISRTGLLATAEAKLILACLKYVLNRVDSLSIAEILLLASGKNIEQIIESRLDYLDRDESQKYMQWTDNDDFIKRLDKLREEAIELSSAEILNLMLEELDLRRIIARWGNMQQRFDNIDVLRKFALQYEEACNRLHTAASLGGFLLWLNEQEARGNDKQGSGEGIDAVNVVTYHKSKGLEYPIVILYSMEGNLRDKIWGINIVSEQTEVDLDNILGNRWLRYWMNPYGDQSRNTPLMERIKESPIKEAASKEAREEEARVLYVGITRARDYLVFPTRNRPTKWLNRVYQDGNEDFPTLDENSHETPWEWNKEYLETNLEHFVYGADFASTEMNQDSLTYLEERIGQREIDTYEIDITEQFYKNTIQISKLYGTKAYSPPVQMKEGAIHYSLAKMLKAFLTADFQNYNLYDRIDMAEAFIERYKVQEMIDHKAMIKHANAWWDYLDSYFHIKQLYRKYPIQLTLDGRVFDKIIDVLIETEEEIIIIQNSGEPKKMKAKAQELMVWMHLSKMAIQECWPHKEVRTYINFVLNGQLLEMKTARIAARAEG